MTCHTYQHADAETLDPAAILVLGTKWTPDHTNPAPNPLELGRLVHRIHRGKTLPTLYKANQSSTGLAPVLGNPDPKGEKPPLPFSPSRSAQNPSNPRPGVLGRRRGRAGANSSGRCSGTRT